jgi:saccharopine dehydrogenase (NAD+, L-lysine-forming)
MTDASNQAATPLHHFWLRAEVKPKEYRTPLLPYQAKQLLDLGHSITVEKSVDTCVEDSEYEAVGCTMVPPNSWSSAPEDAIILGLKELPENNDPIAKKHVYFAHCFKNQAGWRELLNRFVEGQGTLWDLEFLNDANGRRVAAFGASAGFVGMAMGLLAWANKQTAASVESTQPLSAFERPYDRASLINEVKTALDRAGRAPRVIVIGALGRCGFGCSQFAEAVGVEVTKWDLEETKKGGPFEEILDHDIFINCIYLMKPIPPFLTKQMLEESTTRKLSVVVDVSCDASNPHNPVPIYQGCTTFLEPTQRVVGGTLPVDVITIDHLPSLVPYESSKEFAEQLFPHLLKFNQTDVWSRALDLFHAKVASVRL